MKHGANVHDRHGKGRKPFHCAAEGNSIEAMEMLLHNGVSVSYRDKYHRTAFRNAAFRNSVQAIQSLL